MNKLLPFVPALFFALVTQGGAGTVVHWDFEDVQGTGKIAKTKDGHGMELVQDLEKRQPAISESVAASPPGPSSNKHSADFTRVEQSSLNGGKTEKLSFGTGQAFTIEMWINVRSYPLSDSDSLSSVLIQKRGGEPADPIKPGYHLAINFEGRLLFRAEGTEGGGKSMRSTALVALDTWTHVAVSRDSVGHFKIYLNGAVDNAAGGPPFAGSLENGADLLLGCNRFAQGKLFFFDGLMDDVRISDTALEPGGFLFK